MTLPDVGTGVVASDGAGPQFTKPGANCDPEIGPVHSSCKPPDDEPTEVPIYTIKVTGSIFSVGSNIIGGEDGLYETNHHLGFVIVKDIFEMDISSVIPAEVTCGGKLPLALPDVVVEARLSLTSFAIPQLLLFFEHNGVEHWIESLSDAEENWVPTDPEFPVELKDLNGQWEVRTKGKHRQNGCTGEGGLDNNPIDWTATVTLLP